MKIVLAADHGGFELKEQVKFFLTGKGYQIVDIGCSSSESVDYPDFAEKAVREIKREKDTLGILICGTGIGMSIAANRHKSIRAANCHNEFTIRMSREHNNANVLCLGARVLAAGEALNLVDLWLKSEFAGGRHQRRIAKFS